MSHRVGLEIGLPGSDVDYQKQLMMHRHFGQLVILVSYCVVTVNLAMVMIYHSIKTSMQVVMVLFGVMITVPWVLSMQV